MPIWDSLFWANLGQIWDSLLTKSRQIGDSLLTKSRQIWDSLPRIVLGKPINLGQFT